MLKNKIEGFSLIELLVVVAIIGTLAAAGTLAYNGYIAGTKSSAAKNSMQQIALAQQEYYSINGEYVTTVTGNCGVPAGSSTINSDLFDTVGDEKNIDVDGWEFCIEDHATGYKITACAIKDAACDGDQYTLNAKGSNNFND